MKKYIENIKPGDVLPGDIILFSNKSSILSNKSAFWIKGITMYPWNHAAIVSYINPEDEKDKRKYSVGDDLFIYEYANVGEPISYQKLSEKLKEENLNKIAVIRNPNLVKIKLKKKK